MHRTDRNRLGVVPWIALALAIAAAAWLGWDGARARAEADGLRTWQAMIVQRIGAARGGDGMLTPDRAADALTAIVAARDGQGPAAMTSAAQPVASATPPMTADTDAGTEIGRLRRTQSTGTAAGDAQIIEQDSRAAWTGWQ